MYTSGIEYDSISNGDGIRCVLFVSGCRHKCKGCHNPDTWNFKNGEIFTTDIQNKVIEYCKIEYVSGLVLSGGDPMYNVSEILHFIKRFKKECPTKDIWIYSGFTYEQILNSGPMTSLLKLCDVLVDGKFQEKNKDETLSFKGSYNQRIINIKESMKHKSIINWVSTFV